jgi:hypothetical protein
LQGQGPGVSLLGGEQIEAHQVCGSVGSDTGQSSACGEPPCESVEVEPALIGIPADDFGVDDEIAGESGPENPEEIWEVAAQILAVTRP